MSFRKVSMGAAIAISMVSAPVLASTAPAGTAPVAQSVRSGAEMEQSNELGRGGWFIPLLAILAIIAGIIAAVGGDDERPHSP